MTGYEDLLEQVNSKETFLHFLDAFITDLLDSEAKEKSAPSSPYGPAANGWENRTLSPFLDAMHSWSLYEGTDRLHVPEEPSWRTFAEMLAAAKVYE